MVKLGEILKQNKNTEIVEQDKLYRLLGVRLEGKGPFIREEKLGSQIRARKLQRVNSADFIYSRLFAWRGAFGLIPVEMDGAYVSGEFPNFEMNDNRIHPKYLELYFKQRWVWNEVEKRCTGTTKASRNRFKEKFFLDLEILLPPSLDEQKRIGVRIERLMLRVEESRRLRAEATEEAISAMRISSTNVLENCAEKYGVLKFSKYVYLRHGFQFRNYHFVPEGLPIVKISQACANDTLDLSHCNFIDESREQEFEKYKLFKSDLLIALTGGTLGKVTLIDKDYGPIFQNYRVGKLMITDQSKVIKKYLYHLVKSEYFRKMLFEAVNQAAQPNLGKAEFEKFLVPFPPIAEQRRIVAYLDFLQENADELKKLQNETEKEMEELTPSILDKAFKGEL